MPVRVIGGEGDRCDLGTSRSRVAALRLRFQSGGDQGDLTVDLSARSGDCHGENYVVASRPTRLYAQRTCGAARWALRQRSGQTSTPYLSGRDLLLDEAGAFGGEFCFGEGAGNDCAGVGVEERSAAGADESE